MHKTTCFYYNIKVSCSLTQLINYYIYLTKRNTYRSMKKIFQKYQILLTYTFFGSLASLLNLLLFHVLDQRYGVNYLFANVIAYIVAIIFTFVTNKYWVFASKKTPLKQTLKEFTSFCNVRFFSFILDLLLMFAGVQVLAIYKDLAKLIDQLICGILNYFFSKWLIFQKND